MSLASTIFESITPDYSYGKYDNFKVIIMTKNGYINATKLCAENGKEFKQWLRNDGSKGIMNEVDTYLAGVNSLQPSIEIIKDSGSNELRGTYVHPLLVPIIAIWISPAYAFKASKILIDYSNNEYKEQNNKLVQDNNKLSDDIKKLMMINIEQTKTLEEQNKKIDKILGHTERIEEQLYETNNILEVTNDILDGTNETLDEVVSDLSVVQTKLGISVEDRAIKPKSKSKVNQLVVMQSNDDTKLLYITCGQKCNVTRQVNSKIDYKVIKIINNVPNSIYLFDHIKKYFKNRITTKSRYITLVSINADKFIDETLTLFNYRTDIDLTRRP
jgi:hypothetical protein